jgi:glutaconyl-CoA/methylmalonyl-CoA decarboxylase subunit gamma
MRRYTIEVNGKTYMLDVHELSSDSFEVTYEDRQFDVLLVDDTDLPEAAITPVMSDSIGSQAAPAAPVVRPAGRPAAPRAAAPAAPRQAAPSGAGNALTAPMPGVILSIDVKAGARVKRGDVICKLEAMKMVNPIRAPKDTVVAEITVSEGQMVAYGDALVLFGE